MNAWICKDMIIAVRGICCQLKTMYHTRNLRGSHQKKRTTCSQVRITQSSLLRSRCLRSENLTTRSKVSVLSIPFEEYSENLGP